VWQHGGVSLPPYCFAAGAGVGGSQELEDALGVIFFESMKHITFNVFICLLFSDSETPSESSWFWLSPAVSRLSFFLCIHTHTYIRIITIIVYYISWCWQNRHRPEFCLKCLLVPQTQSWYFADTGPRTGLYHYYLDVPRQMCVFLFVCRYTPQKSLICLPPWSRRKTPGSIYIYKSFFVVMPSHS